MPAELTVTLPDGAPRAVAAGTTGLELASSLSPRIAKEAVAAAVDGRLVDLGSPLPDGASVRIVAAGTEEGREVLRHSTAHVMAQAVLELWPGARFAIGPAIEDGFYYDFELPGGARFSEDDLPTIEAKMREIIDADQAFVRGEHTRDQAQRLFADQPFKLEVIDAVGDGEVVSTYANGADFLDLCRGPHVPATGRLGHFKLTRVAGAYWRGDERRPQLQRIYGTAFESASALADHLHRLEEAERRDHRRLGAELDLFHFPPQIGGGLPIFHPKGALIRQLIEDFSVSAHQTHGYQQVWTPHVAKSTLFETSGHLEWYAEGMYPPMEMEGATYYLKPMNCPMHILVYASRSRSYRELPMRLFELGTVYRFERSGVLHGLARVRGITQDDSHIFCAPEQLADELASLLAFMLDILRAFGMSEFEAELATRPEKFVGDPADWEHATDALRHALEVAELPYVVAEGEGAFYAPKVDVHLRDAIGRRWQVSTLQVDFQEPQRFDLHYVGADNERHVPRMIHRALLGSIERFMAILLEHYAGALPTWLAPMQVRVLPVRDDHERYASEIVERLRASRRRADCEPASEPLGGRVRRAKLEKIPYVLVVGDDDVAAATVGVNARGSERPERGVELAAFLERLEADLSKEGRLR